MEAISLIAGLAKLILSFLLGMLVAYGSFRLFAFMNRRVDEIQELKANNVAVAILHSAMMFSAALIIHKALAPATSSFQTALFKGIDLLAILKVAGLALGYVAIVITLAVVAIVFSAWVFLRLTRELDELAEIQRNNIAVALLLGTVLIIMSLFLSHGIETLLSALIPYPAVESIQIMGQPR